MQTSLDKCAFSKRCVRLIFPMIVPLPSETVGTRLGSFMYQDEDVATLDIFDRSVHQGKQFSPYQDPPTFDLGARIVAYKGRPRQSGKTRNTACRHGSKYTCDAKLPQDTQSTQSDANPTKRATHTQRRRRLTGPAGQVASCDTHTLPSSRPSRSSERACGGPYSAIQKAPLGRSTRRYRDDLDRIVK